MGTNGKITTTCAHSLPIRQHLCSHHSHTFMDNWIDAQTATVISSKHYHTLRDSLATSDLKCLKDFHISKVTQPCHMKSTCCLKRRLSQACYSILHNEPNPNDEIWFKNDWTILVICLANKLILPKIHPHQDLTRTTILST